MRKDNFDGLRQAFDDKIRGICWGALDVAVIDQYGAATGGVSGIDVTPTIAHHPTPAEVDAEGMGGLEQHTGRRFTVGGRFVPPWVVTHLDSIEAGDQFK